MKNNKKWIGLGIGLVCLVLCLVLLLSMCGGRGEDDPDGTGQTTDPAQTTASTEQTEETSEPTEETSAATEPTEEDTEPTEESTEPTTGGGSGGSSVGNFTGGSTSSGSSGVTEDTGSETEPTEEIITVSDPGTEENPYAESLVEIPAAVSTVKIPTGGEISYYLYHAAGSVLTVEDSDAYILYNGVTYSPVDGIVTVRLEENDSDEPVSLVVGSKSASEKAFTLNFAHPVGSASNPQIMESLDQLLVSLENGDEDGYFFTWTATGAGTVTFKPDTVVPEDVKYDIIVTLGDTVLRLSDREDGSVSMEVEKDDVVTVQVVTLPNENGEYPAAEITISAFFTEKEMDVYILEDGVPQTLTVPAGGMIWVQADATGKTMNLTVDGSRMYFEWYVQIGTEMGTPSAAGVYRSELSNAVYLFPIYNTSEETDAVLVVSAVSPVPGSAEYPLVIGEMGQYQASVSEGSEGVYYTWTAPEDGTLTVSIDTDAATVGWMYFVNNETGAVYGDTHWSDDDPLVSSQDVAVSAGDVVTIWVSTYDPANPTVAPEGEVAFSLSFTVSGEGGAEDPEEPKAGTETNPYILEDGVTYSLTLPANGVIWVQVDATEDVMTLTVDGGRQYFDWYVLIDQVQGVPGVSGAYASALSGGVFVLPIYSTSADTDAVLQVTASSPVFGTVDNPEVISQMGDFSAELEENNEGYYYTWTATKDGFLTVTIDTENTATGWQFFVNNISSGIFGDRHWSDDEPLVASEKIAVSEGDVVEIWVGTYDPESYNTPAGTVAFTLHFEVPEGVEDPLGSDTNPYILEPGNSYSLTIPAESEIYVQFEAGEELYLSLASERNYYGWYVTINGTQYTHFRNMTYGTELDSGTRYLLPIGNTMESEIVLEVTLSTMASLTGTYEFPEELEALGELTAQVEKGDNGYYYSWIAEMNGTLTLTIDTENCAEETGWQYSIYDVTDSRTTAIHTSGDDPLVPSDSLTVKEGDEIQIWVGTFNPENGQELPAGEVPFKLTFTLAVDSSAAQGSIYNPYVFVDGDSKNLTIPAGETVYIRVDATMALMELNLSGNRMYYDWTVTVNGTAYGPYANGARSVELQGDSYLIPITNTSDESQQVLTVTLNTLASLMGTLEHPQVLTELGDISVMIEGGTDTECYYFYWTATTSGTLRTTIDTDMCENGWQYSVSNITRSRVTDKHTSSDETLVPSDSIEFTEGDLIQIWVCTYNAEDPFVPPAGMVYFNLSLIHHITETPLRLTPQRGLCIKYPQRAFPLRILTL